MNFEGVGGLHGFARGLHMGVRLDFSNSGILTKPLR